MLKKYHILVGKKHPQICRIIFSNEFINLNMYVYINIYLCQYRGKELGYTPNYQ